MGFEYEKGIKSEVVMMRFIIWVNINNYEIFAYEENH